MTPEYRLPWHGVALAVAMLLFGAFFAGPVVGVQNQTGNDTLELELSAQSTTVSAGDSVTVDVLVTNTGNTPSPAPVFDLGLPQSGWNISTWTAPNATYRESTNEWLWTELEAGEEAELTFTLQSAHNASALTVEGEVTDGRNASVSDELEITFGNDGAPTSTTEESATGLENTGTEAPPATFLGGGIPSEVILGLVGFLAVGLLIILYGRFS